MTPTTLSFAELTRRLGELSGAPPREIPELRPITTPLAELDMRDLDAEEMAQLKAAERTSHE